MTDSPFECFMADVFDEIQKRYIESQKDMSENQNDLFISGRALGIVRKLFSHFTLKNNVFSSVSTRKMY